MEKKIKIFIENTDQIVLLSQGRNLLEGLMAAGVPINNSCGGGGTCGTCRIEVLSDLTTLPNRTWIEQEMAEDRKFRDNERLSCQLEPSNDIKIRIF